MYISKLPTTFKILYLRPGLGQIWAYPVPTWVRGPQCAERMDCIRRSMGFFQANSSGEQKKVVLLASDMDAHFYLERVIDPVFTKKVFKPLLSHMKFWYI